MFTCTGPAATSRPATPPPTTRPSELDNETLIPPDLLLVPWFSVGMNDPDKESISKRPYTKGKRKVNIRFIAPLIFMMEPGISNKMKKYIY